jgi:alpha-L-fucosidase
MSARPHLHAVKIVMATLAVVFANLTTAAATAAPVSPMAEVTSISPTDTPAQIIAKAASVTPSPRQLAWQRLEQTAFLHFGVNTYDDRQVGTGTENPDIFQPTGLNTDQWVLALKNAGFKQAILTAKHHDGFLLFPSRHSSLNTLYELLTRYGTVDEVWWDGANPTGANEPYDYTSWIQIVRALQPGAVMFQDIDVRWVGNEDGVSRPSEWSPLPYIGDPATAADRFIPPTTDPWAQDLASDAVLGQRRANGDSAWNFLRWSPAECDTSMMNGGYFWFPGVTARSQAELTDIYYTSVGRNCQLLINVPPDRDGVLDQTMLDALAAYGNTITSTFSHDLAAGAAASNDSGTANAGGHQPNLAVDGNLDTSWQPTGSTGGLVLDLGGTRTFDVVSVQEDLNTGMRTRNFAVDAWNGTTWTQIATDTTIGHKKLIRLGSPVSTDRVRLRITAARAAPAIAAVGLFQRPSGGSARTGPVGSGIAGKCLDINGGSNADGTHAQMWDCNGTVAQVWSVRSDGTLQMFGKCLDINGNSTANGALVQLWTCNGGGNQHWQAVNGALVNPLSGRCLDDPGFNSANGTQLVIWDCNGGANQRWTLPG